MLRGLFRTLFVVLSATGLLFAQSQNASLDGQVTDKSGAVITQATVTITGAERNISSSVQTDANGRYSFPNLNPGTYNLSVQAKGFRTYEQQGIQLLANQTARIDAGLEVGEASTKVEVVASAAQLNYENGTQQGDVPPTIVNQLPLLVSAGTPRNAAQFASFLPGVNTGTSVQPYNSRINGGLKMGDEAVMDGVSMQEGTMSQSGMVSLYDFPETPDMVSEVQVLTSSYEPQYGTTTGGEIIVTTRSGTDQFHGGVFEYLRNKDLNALQFTNQRPPGDARPKDNENQFGGFIGGPVKLPFIPFVWGPKHKTYFFHDEEYLRSLGGTIRPVVSIPSVQERTGNFSDLGYQLYDPKTESITNGVIHRAPYVNNQIPVSEQSPLALEWEKYLPTPTGAGPYNNYLSTPVSDGILSNLDEFLYKVDHYWGDKDHIFVTIWRQKTGLNEQCALPVQLCTSSPASPEDAWVSRVNWDHIFTPTLLSHFAVGYLNRNEGYGSVSGQHAADLPQIPNAAAYFASPAANFNSGNGISNFASWGNTQGPGYLNKTTRPSYVGNELVTLVRGAHTFKLGGEFRHLQQVFRSNNNQSGTLAFDARSTGLPGIQSGDPFASFLIGAVDNGNLNVHNVSKYGAEQLAFSAFGGDTWKVTPRFTLNYGLRWDKWTPTYETSDRMAFFSFAQNPGAGNLPGSLAFSGSNWGPASAGVKYPETPFNLALSPRLGAAYKVTDNTVIRAGYGVFYTQAFYPGWGGGMSLDGFNPLLSFNDSLGGYQPSFYMDNGFPAYNKAPNVTSTADNGTNGPNYRPTYANHLPYTQQWNFTIEQKLGASSIASIAYVGSKGTHLPSQNQPLNSLNPDLLGLGPAVLNSVFQPGQTSLYGVSVPYANWVQTLDTVGTCKPTVAQALVRFPQYCGALYGQNESQGTSEYNSAQAKIERNFSSGLYLGANYTFSKLITNAASTTQATSGGQVIGIINPYQGNRNKSISPDDVTHAFNLLGVYDLPFGPGKRWLGGSGVLSQIVGGWTLSSSIKLTSGMPFFFNDSTVCGVPNQFTAECIPAILPNAKVLTQSWSGFNVNQPAFNAAAFEPTSLFASGTYLGAGPRVTNVRGTPYRDTNIALAKKFIFKERLNLEIRAEAFNIFNNHYFTCDGQFSDCVPFNNDPSSSKFGTWNGTVSQPRNVQLVGRLTF